MYKWPGTDAHRLHTDQEVAAVEVDPGPGPATDAVQGQGAVHALVQEEGLANLTQSPAAALGPTAKALTESPRAGQDPRQQIAAELARGRNKRRWVISILFPFLLYSHHSFFFFFEFSFLSVRDNNKV